MTPDSLLLRERKDLRDLLNAAGSSEIVVLVGSWARGTYIPDVSDIDVLVIGEARPRQVPIAVQLVRVSLGELRSRVEAGDDFLQWALRYGRPLKGRRRWETLRDELLGEAPWPDPRVKMGQAERRSRVARALLDMGDLDAAAEETRYALAHLARAQLLADHVFPLSRPELPGQLRALDQEELAAGLERSSSPAQLTAVELDELSRLIERRLGPRGDPGSDQRA